ncbi:MAG: hypothetical protein AAGJ36_12190, partial [Pseudomonadota bacterium]
AAKVHRALHGHGGLLRLAEGEAMVFKGENAHPVTGSMYTMKSVARELGDGKSIMDMYENYGQGMVKAFTVTMTPK